MRYVCMHKVSPNSEAALPPSPELVAGMGKLIGELGKQGKLLGGGGLKPSRERLRLEHAGGTWKVTPGPLTGRNELPAGLATIKVATREQAIDWAKRYGAAVGAQEVELGPLTEPWDLGLCPKPDHAPLQFMILHKATKASEAGAALPAKNAIELAKLKAEMVKAGVLTFAELLQPSSSAMRLHFRGGARSVADGPFTESKELIGGFTMVKLGSRDEVLAFCDRFAQIIGEDFELDVRLAAEPAEGAPAR